MKFVHDNECDDENSDGEKRVALVDVTSYKRRCR